VRFAEAPTRSVAFPRARLLAWAALLAQLGGLLHAALVPHVTCPGHGDFVHVASIPAVDAPHPWAVLQDPADDDGAEGHDRCLLDEDGESAPPEHAAAPAAPAALVTAVLPAYAAPPATAHEPLYRIAPKNSPPA
jgi:hypothetical protein